MRMRIDRAKILLTALLLALIVVGCGMTAFFVEAEKRRIQNEMIYCCPMIHTYRGCEWRHWSC